MLDSAEHDILNAHKYTNIKKFSFLSGSSKPRMLFFLLIDVKMPTIVGILTFMSRKMFMLSWVEHGKTFITWGQVTRAFILTRESKRPNRASSTRMAWEKRQARAPGGGCQIQQEPSTREKKKEWKPNPAMIYVTMMSQSYFFTVLNFTRKRFSRFV